MCNDYSLIKLSNRLASEGEELIVHKFRSGRVGLVSRSDFCRWRAAAEAEFAKKSIVVIEPPSNFMQAFKDFFTAFLTFYGFLCPNAWNSDAEPGPVVGIPSEALVRVFGISPDLQLRYKLGSFEDALFTAGVPLAGRQDVLYFGNGVMVALHVLQEGQKIKVLRRSWAESLEPAPEPVRVNA